MTMVALPGLPGGGSVDVCDVAFLLVTGTARCALYLCTGGVLAVDAPAASTRAAIDAAVPGLMTALLSATMGDVYVAGAKLLRIQPANGLLGSTWLMQPGTVTFNAITPAAADALVNACTRCGGGGGGTQTAYTDLQDLDVAPTPGGLVLADTSGTLTLSTPFPMTYTRQGQLANAGAPGAGDLITMYLVIGFAQVAPGTPVVSITSLPVPANPAAGVTYAGAFPESAAVPSIPGADTILMTWDDPVASANGAMLYEVSYRSAT